MNVNSKTVALVLSLLIATITAAFSSLMPQADGVLIATVGGLTFGTSFLPIYFTMEFLIFREINKIYQAVEKLRQKEWKGLPPLHQEQNFALNPIVRINEDITRYLSLQERELDELRRIEAYRREFLADVSHELKTPIFAAQGYILTLLDGAADDENVRYKFLRKAAKSLNGLDALVQDLLTLSQMESGMITMKYQVFDIRSLVLEVMDQLEHKAQKKGIGFVLEPDSDAPVYVHADFSRISQVLINLISNGIKYGNEDGWVKVRLEEKTAHHLIHISDNGIGIAPEHLGRVFERFYRVDKSRSKKQGGTGLGLAICKHILESHKSKIKVQSQPGVGTTFSFKLEKGQAAAAMPQPRFRSEEEREMPNFDV